MSRCSSLTANWVQAESSTPPHGVAVNPIPIGRSFNNRFSASRCPLPVLALSTRAVSIKHLWGLVKFCSSNLTHAATKGFHKMTQIVSVKPSGVLAGPQARNPQTVTSYLTPYPPPTHTHTRAHFPLPFLRIYQSKYTVFDSTCHSNQAASCFACLFLWQVETTRHSLLAII